MTKNISKTLIIGLGGTGQRVICDIKKRMLRTYGEIPSLVKFLAFDTDEMYRNGAPFRYYHEGHTFEDYKYSIQCNEFYRILAPSLEAVRRDPIFADHLRIEELGMSWRHHRPASNRIAVRACFLNSSRDIINRLSAAISELRCAAIPMHEMADGGYNIINNNISVFVIASLAGNTGSSAIMDISRMLQIAGLNVHYSANPVCDKIFGMFFLPKFFESYSNTPNINIKVNTFTALSELDYTLGLADGMKYPMGSSKLEDDQQDYHGYINNGKRVIYNGIYLIDSLTSGGHTHDFQEASNNVASFIASSIAADANTLITNYVNSNHKMHSVDGKFLNYSSLGYCELRFNRQELVRYLLNRKLISVLEQFKAGDHGVSVSQIAQSFINGSNLNEGVKWNSEGVDTRPQLNTLTDAIINMDDKRFDAICFPMVEPGREAANNIETAKIVYLNRIGTTAQQAVQAFGQRKQELIQNLKTLLDNRMKEKGFGRFPDLVKCLKTTFTDMKEGLVDELEWNAELFDRIDDHELRQLKINIEEKGILCIGSRRNKQEAAIRWYCDKVRFDNGRAHNPTLAWLKVDSARKREAVAIYEEMIEILDSYYKEKTVETLNGIETWITGSFLNVDALYRGLHDQLLKENNCYRPTKAAKNEILFADAYFKEYFEQHEANEMNLTMQVKHELEQHIGQLFADQPVADASLLVQMRGKLLDLLGNDDIVKRIHGYTVTTKDANDNYFETKVMMSIDELFILCFGTYNQIADPNDIETYPQLRMLKTLENNFDLLWHYKPFTEGLAPEKHLVVGVCDTQNSIFNPQNGYQAALNRWDNNYCYINLGDPDRIAFMLTETAIPAHKLEGMENWAMAFMHKRHYYPFSDKRLEDIDMVMPDMYKEAEIAWAYGWLFGLIANPTNIRGLRVKPSHDYVVRNTINIEEGDFYNYFKNMRPSDIYECHQEFIKDQELSNDILQQAMVLLDNDPVGNAIKIRQWVNDGQMWDHDVRGKQRTTMTPEEIEVIQNEVKYLAMCFDKLGISLNECGRVV